METEANHFGGTTGSPGVVVPKRLIHMAHKSGAQDVCIARGASECGCTGKRARRTVQEVDADERVAAPKRTIALTPVLLPERPGRTSLPIDNRHTRRTIATARSAGLPCRWSAFLPPHIAGERKLTRPLPPRKVAASRESLNRCRPPCYEVHDK